MVLFGSVHTNSEAYPALYPVTINVAREWNLSLTSIHCWV